MEYHPLLRPYHSDTSLATNPLQLDSSSNNHAHLFPAQSEPILSSRVEEDIVTYQHLISASEALEAIVAEGALVGVSSSCLRALRAAAGQLRDGDSKGADDEKVLKIVYGTMKYLHYIDIILVKTQFLVYYPDFLSHLGLVKIVMYLHLQTHFDPLRWTRFVTSPTITADQSDLIGNLEEAVKIHRIKLGAALARLRIEKRAVGETVRDQVEALLPFELRMRESVSVGMPKYVRVNLLKTTPTKVADLLRKAGFHVDLSQKDVSAESPDTIVGDSQFDDLLIVPATVFNDLKAHEIMTDGLLIFQDKASAFAPRQLASLLHKSGAHIIDARAGCGTRVTHLAALTKDKHRIFAFESRAVRNATLRVRLEAQGVKSVEVVEDDFMSVNVKDPKYEKVSTIICEPACSGSAIVDKLGYMLQEEEFPADRYSKKDMVGFKRQQYLMLRKASQFPNVRNIVYVTRTTRREENDGVVEEFLDMAGGRWKVSPVLSALNASSEESPFLEKIPSASGNGIFVASFTKCVIPIDHTNEMDGIDVSFGISPAADMTASLQHLNVSGTNKKRRVKKSRNSVDSLNSSKRPSVLTKSQLKASVERLSSTTKQVKSSSNSNRASQIAKKASQQSEDDDDKDGDAEDKDEEAKGDEEDDQHQFDYGLDFVILGVSLKEFYAPKAEALTVLARKQPFRWSYPVPNPMPWK
ncbi:hypothetical protein SmJEL517_g05356 [Synchytrium microbalum]|uniref:SAM-dependent MTase RsmB/NOP-type domain-containing protein n=1 Tax=Synchytrium microbalum TaxID=1806994 RepID=A0A507BZL8_9FUNG|nr:uncharacterized protein SmJEL517_g05356 [Synchytrium microbalum]TPX31254.1 hypothetical protein SmJEL517_g05356 [Synchytrium microbalum]